MKASYIFAAFAFSALLIASCGKNTGGCYKGEKAKIRDFSASDSCGIVIQLEDGTKLEPTNLAEFKGIEYTEGKLIWVSYKPASGASTCGLGEIVEIKCIAERPY